MFGLIRNVIDRAVDKASGAAKVTVEVATTLTAAVVAEPLKKVVGDNPVSNKLWELQDKVAGKLSELIEDAAPVTKAIVKAPVRKAERLCELGHGISQVLWTDQKQAGYAKIDTALTEMAAILITGGIAGAALEYCAEVADVAQELPAATEGHPGGTATGVGEPLQPKR